MGRPSSIFWCSASKPLTAVRLIIPDCKGESYRAVYYAAVILAHFTQQLHSNALIPNRDLAFATQFCSGSHQIAERHVCFISWLWLLWLCLSHFFFPWSLCSYHRWVGFLVTWFLFCAVHPQLEAATVPLCRMYPWREQRLYTSVTWWNHKHRLKWLLRLQTCTVESGRPSTASHQWASVARVFGVFPARLAQVAVVGSSSIDWAGRIGSWARWWEESEKESASSPSL